MVAPEIQVSLPSKCFFLGEYAVLQNCPAILATFEPNFICSAQAMRTPQASCNTSAPQKNRDLFVHPDSPAGRLWSSDEAFFSKWDIQFSDPFPSGMGGFGRSSAEFAALYLLREKSKPVESGTIYEMAWKARNEYRSLLEDKTPIPSGADLVAQMVNVGPGSLVYLDFNDQMTQEINRYPDDLQLYIFPTGMKVPTHEHLAKLGALPENFVEELNSITSKVQSILTRFDRNPIESIERLVEIGELFDCYHALLAGKNLLDRTAMDFRDRIRSLTGVVGAKGCGALGADIVLAAVRSEERSRFLYEVNSKDLHNGFNFHGCFDFRAQKWITKPLV